MQALKDETARARADDPKIENGELRAAPKIAVERLVASGHSDDGALVSLCIETGTQGLVTLVVEAGKVGEIIDMLAAELVRAFKAAEIAGEPPKRLMFPVQAFAVGEVSPNPGVLLTLNQGQQGERSYLIADPQHAITLAQMLTKQAASNPTVIHNRRRLILPGRNGPN